MDAISSDDIRERLRAKKAEAERPRETILPVSGITVTYVGFLSHGAVMAAQKIAGKATNRVASIIISQKCTFGGVRMVVDEVETLLDSRDLSHLVDLFFGEPEGKGGEVALN